MKTTNPRFVYPMSDLTKMLTPEQVSEFSKDYEFNEDDKYFHVDEENGMLESLNDEDIDFYNSYVPKTKMLLKAA